MNQQRGKEKGCFQPQTLDIDETIFDKNLKIVDNELETQLSGAFPGLKPSIAATSKQFTQEPNQLFPQAEYPAVQVRHV